MAQMAALLQAQKNMIAPADNRLAPQLKQASRESDLEDQRRQEKMLELLVKIEKNTAGTLEGFKKSGTKKPDDNTLGIGALGTALAVGLGAIVGYIKGYVTLLGKLAKVLIPEKWIAAIKNGFNTIVDFFGKIADLIGKGFQKIRSLFVFDDASAIGKAITALKEGITKFFAPIMRAVDLIKDGSSAVKNSIGFVGDFLGKIKSFFSTLSAYGNEFAKVFSGTVKIFSKLAIPLTVIMTLWDTIKETIAGFEKEGIVGAIAGAVKGFFNSLIFAPLDMLKSAISWVLGVFGFDKAEKALDSFSFQTMFSDMIDNLAKPFMWVRDKAIELWNTFNWDETWTKITGFVTESIDSVVGGFGKLKDGIISFWDSWSIDGVMESLSKQLSEIENAISNWFKQKFNKIKSFLGFGDEEKPQQGSTQVKPPEANTPAAKQAQVKTEPVIIKSPEEVEPSAQAPSGPSTLSKIKNFFGFGKSEQAAAPVTAGNIVPVIPESKPIDVQRGNVTPPTTGNKINAVSAEAEQARLKAMKTIPESSKTAIVNAPVTNNQNNLIKSNIRNQESSLSRYIQSKYA